MKTLKKLLCAMLLPLSALAVSCAEDDNWEPGGPEATNCYDVYFPENQEYTGDLEIDPEAELKFTYVAQRNNADGAIVVPVEITTNTEGLYTVSPIEFADGEDETTFTVTLSGESELSKKYSLEINIVDPQYVPLYSTANNTSLLLSLTRVKWTEVLSGTFISAFWEESHECKMYQKDDSSHYKITNFLGLDTDFFFEWDAKSNMCQLDGWIYTGFDYQGDASQPSYLMDGAGVFNTWLGGNLSWAAIEQQQGIPQPYYDPDKKAFFFHLFAGVPAIGEGRGFGWFDEVFLLEGGSLGCDLSLEMMLPSEFNPELSSKFNDYENLIYVISGTNLTSLQYAILPTEVYNNPAAAGIEDLEAFLNEYGIDGSEKDSEGKSELDYIAEDGGYVGIWIKRDAGVSYTMFAKATNANGEDAFVTCEYTTAQMVDLNAPIVGKYNMTYSETLEGGEVASFENTFSVTPADDSGTKFLVKDLGLEGSPLVHYGVYDAAAGTFTLDGSVVGYESYGNVFGRIDIFVNQQHTQGFRYWSYEDIEGDSVSDPMVFTVDSETKKLNSLTTYLELPLISYVDEKPSEVLGDAAFFTPQSTVALAGEDAASAKSFTRSNVPFSSVRNMNTAKPLANSAVIKSVAGSNVCSATAKRLEGAKFSIKPGIKNAKLTDAVSKL